MNNIFNIVPFFCLKLELPANCYNKVVKYSFVFVGMLFSTA